MDDFCASVQDCLVRVGFERTAFIQLRVLIILEAFGALLNKKQTNKKKNSGVDDSSQKA